MTEGPSRIHQSERVLPTTPIPNSSETPDSTEKNLRIHFRYGPTGHRLSPAAAFPTDPVDIEDAHIKRNKRRLEIKEQLTGEGNPELVQDSEAATYDRNGRKEILGPKRGRERL